MKAQIFKMSRSGSVGVVVYQFPNTPIRVYEFPASWTDQQVLEKIGAAIKREQEEEKTEIRLKPVISEAKPEVCPVVESVKPEPVSEPEEPKRKESINDVRAKKHALKEKYLADLKKVGIDKSKEPSFARIEAAWKKYCGDKKSGK